MKVPNVELKTERSALVAGKKQTIDVLVRITPPAAETNGSTRPKLNIGIALDRSGSMGGSKMHEAREAAKYCVDQLLDTDRFSAVIFDDIVDVLFTNQFVKDREMLKRGLSRIEARNSTALHEGWLTAGRQVSEALDRAAINRVLLITDGQANVGETNVDRIVSAAREAASRGVTTTTIGIGRDFNEDLLIPMAEAGEGNAWHVEGPEDMARIFESELKGLVRQFANSVTLTAEPAAGVRVLEILNDLGRPGDTSWPLPNLMGGSPLDLVVRLEISEASASPGEMVKFTLRYTPQADIEPLVMYISFAPAFATQEAVDALAPDATVIEAVRLLMNARARREAVEYMDRGDIMGSAGILRSVVASTRAAHAASPSMALADEIAELDSLAGSVESGEDRAMSRKQAYYQSDSRRKGRER